MLLSLQQDHVSLIKTVSPSQNLFGRGNEAGSLLCRLSLIVLKRAALLSASNACHLPVFSCMINATSVYSATDPLDEVEVSGPEIQAGTV